MACKSICMGVGGLEQYYSTLTLILRSLDGKFGKLASFRKKLFKGTKGVKGILYLVFS